MTWADTGFLSDGVICQFDNLKGVTPQLYQVYNKSPQNKHRT